MTRKLLGITLGLVGAALCMRVGADDANSKKETPAVLNFKMKSLAGKEIDLAKYRGKVVLIVNVASQCGYTPQYKGLQALHEKYEKDGLVILGFPCNQFGAQEPGTSEEIAQFCKQNYGVTFDMFSKIEVNGDKQCDLYKYLTSKDSDAKFAGAIKWNFEKFLIARDGAVVGRFPSSVAPESDKLAQAISAEIAKK